MTDQEPSAAFKVVLMGETGVGKSSLVYRMVDGLFFAEHCPTIGVDFKYVRKHFAGVRVDLQLWDTAGQDQFLSVTTQHFRGCHGIVMCFDLTARSSFEKLDAWRERVIAQLGSMPPTLVVGCKLDLADAGDRSPGKAASSPSMSLRQVGTDEAATYSQRHGYRYVETSAKDGRSVGEAFDDMLRLLLDHHGVIGREKGGSARRSAVKPPPGRSVSPGQTEQKKPVDKGCSC
jgi:small GTP-binding protein